MSSFLTIRDKKTNEKINISIQEYSIGLYVIEDNDPRRQYGLNCSEEEFIESLTNNPNIEIIKEL